LVAISNLFEKKKKEKKKEAAVEVVMIERCWERRIKEDEFAVKQMEKPMGTA
jgi:hypothetical protein